MVLAVSWTSGRDSAGMSAGTMKVEFSEPLSGCSSWWILKKPCDRATRSTSPATSSEPFAQDRAADLAAGHGLLDQDLRVVLARGLQRARQLVFSGDLADAERRARTGRLDEDGIGEPVGLDLSFAATIQNFGVAIPALRATT